MKYQIGVIGLLFLSFFNIHSCQEQSERRIKKIIEWRHSAETGKKLHIQKVTLFDSLGRIIQESEYGPSARMNNFEKMIWVLKSHNYYDYSGNGEDDEWIIQMDFKSGHSQYIMKKYKYGKLISEDCKFTDAKYNTTKTFMYNLQGLLVEEVSEGHKDNILGNYHVFFDYDEKSRLVSINSLSSENIKESVWKINYPEKYYEIRERIESDYKIIKEFNLMGELSNMKIYMDGELFKEEKYEYDRTGQKIQFTEITYNYSSCQPGESITYLQKDWVYEYEYY